MILEAALIGAAVAGGAWMVTLARRSRAHGRWKTTFLAVAEKIGGRASPGSMFDAPELRAELEGTTVTLKLSDVHADERSVVRAEANVGGIDERLRMYIGWDAPKTPEGLAHFPEVVAARGVLVEGKLDIRGSDPETTRRFAELAARALAELRRTTNGRGIEVIVRGGYLELRVLGPDASAEMIETLARSAAELVLLIRRAASREALPAGAAVGLLGTGEEVRVSCELCTDTKKPGERWVRCAKCTAPYHLACWHQAERCVVEGCGGTDERPFEDAAR